MTISEPLIFEPIFMERVWGGRRLETLFQKRLPHGVTIGESWEISDREEAQSVVHNGALRGRTLHELWTEFREPIFGKKLANSEAERFPLLIKLLDAEQRLSVQVHPPADVAAELGGEPKTEMWVVLNTHLDSDIFAGLEEGVTRDDFETALHDGHVAEKIHRIPVKPGDALFIPSGRIHAVGAGNVIFEVQQNSDTTYRVFDWNRLGLDGKPRELHIENSLKSIDFDDIEPKPLTVTGEEIKECEYFRVERWQIDAPREACAEGEFAIITCLKGEVECGSVRAKAGDFFVVPATLANRELRPANGSATLLRTTIPG